MSWRDKLSNISTGIITTIGSVSDSVQSYFGASKLSNFFYPKDKFPKTHQTLTIIAATASAARISQSLALEWPNIIPKMRGLFQKSDTTWKETFLAFFKPDFLKQFPLAFICFLINSCGASAAAMTTIIGLLEILPAYYLIGMIIFASIDGLQTLWTEGSFLEDQVKRVLSCGKSISHASADQILHHYNDSPTQTERITWWISFVLLGGANAAIEAGFTIFALSEFAKIFSIENSVFSSYSYCAIGARAAQNIALDGDGVANFVSSFFAKTPSLAPNTRSNCSTIKSVMATATTSLVGMLCAALSAAVGAVGMAPIAAYLTSSQEARIGLCIAGAALRALQNICIETRQLHYTLKEKICTSIEYLPITQEDSDIKFSSTLPAGVL